MIYLAGIDTLVIGFYLKKFNLTEYDYKLLDTTKEMAKAPAFKSSGQYVNFKQIDFTITPAGQKPYTYVLFNGDFTVKIAQKASEKRFPEVFLEIRSQFLWRLGYKNCYTFLKEWVSTWADIADDVVSRADLSVDLSGFPDISIENIVSRARKGKTYYQLIPIQQREIYYYGSKITGWVFGSGPLMMRIYDKLAESKKVQKEWFQDLWKQGGWKEDSDVTRVELQIRRDFLKDFNVTDFKSLEDSLGDIFRYVTRDWFTLRQSSGGKNRSRWPITPFWSEVQAAINDFGKICGLARGRIKEVKENNLIPQIAGLLTSIAATRDNFTFEELLYQVNRHYTSKGKIIEDVIAGKRQRLTTFEDCCEPF